jgi:hypothetical protein
MQFNSLFDCVIGSQLFGIAKDIRYKNIHADERVLKDYNDNYLILKNNCECEIIKICTLSDEEFKQCMQKLREVGYNPHDTLNDKLGGNRIFCEFDKEPKMLDSRRRQEVVMKGRICVGFISKEFVPSGRYTELTRFVKNPNLKT